MVGVRDLGRRELLLLVGFAVLVLAGTSGAAIPQEPPRPPDLGLFLLIGAAVGVLAWRRQAPVSTLGVVTGAASLYVVLGYPFGPVQLCVVVSSFEVARRRAGWVTMAACGLATVVLAISLLSRLTGQPGVMAAMLLLLIWPTVLVVIPALVGALVRSRTVAAARMRRELLSRGAMEERARVGREVHDVAGHALGVVAMQAGIALLVFDERPEQARESLRAISASSSQALDELRATLDVFHRPARDHGDARTRHGRLGVAALGPLLERVRAAGLPVELEHEGAAVTLPEPVDAALYRVVQESLTNVLRHAGRTRARVRLVWRAGEVVVLITDRGRGPGANQAESRGLAGMRARVEDLGGEFTAGPGSVRGFEVSARLPVDGGRK